MATIEDLGQAGSCPALELRAGCSGMMVTWGEENDILASNGADPIKKGGNDGLVHGR